MKNSIDILDWIKQTNFQCDVTKDDCKYADLHVAWYDKSVDKGDKTIVYQDKFMLVKQGEGFKRLKTHTEDDWSLSSRALENILKEDIILFFTDL